MPLPMIRNFGSPKCAQAAASGNDVEAPGKRSRTQPESEKGLLAYRRLVKSGELDNAEITLSRAIATDAAGKPQYLAHLHKVHSELLVAQDRVSEALRAAVKALGYPHHASKDRAQLYLIVAYCLGHLIDPIAARRVLERHALSEAERSNDAEALVMCHGSYAALMHTFACWSSGIPHSATFGLRRGSVLASAEEFLKIGQEHLEICKRHWDDVSAVTRCRAMAQAGCVSALANDWKSAAYLFKQATETSIASRAYVAAAVPMAMGCRIANRPLQTIKLLRKVTGSPFARTAYFQRVVSHELFLSYRCLGQSEKAAKAFENFSELEKARSRLAPIWMENSKANGWISEDHDVVKAVQSSHTEPGEYALRRAHAYLESNLDQAVNVGDVATAARVSTRTLQALFLKYHGLSPAKFIREKRMQTARHLLEEATTVQSVADSLGFSNPANFSRDYRRRFGMTPSSVKGHSAQ